jgi:hypothetical protein
MSHKPKFGVYFKSLATTYGMEDETYYMLYQPLKSKDDYKVGDIVCNDSGYDGLYYYSFYKIINMTNKRVYLKKYNCADSTFDDNIKIYSRRDNGAITSSKTTISIYNKLKSEITDKYSFDGVPILPPVDEEALRLKRLEDPIIAPTEEVKKLNPFKALYEAELIKNKALQKELDELMRELHYY